MVQVNMRNDRMNIFGNKLSFIQTPKATISLHSMYFQLCFFQSAKNQTGKSIHKQKLQSLLGIDLLFLFFSLIRYFLCFSNCRFSIFSKRVDVSFPLGILYFFKISVVERFFSKSSIICL